MNLISNCCATGYLYKEILKQEFPNPFIWSAIVPQDVIKMIKNWNKIDFNNIKIEESFIHKREERNYRIRVDNTFDIHYTHYILSITDDIPRVDGCNIYFKNIVSFTIEKFKKRLLRKSFKESPVFLILDNKADMTFTLEDVKELLTCTEHKIVFVTDKLLKDIPSNFLYIHKSGFDHEKIMKMYKDEILEFAK